MSPEFYPCHWQRPVVELARHVVRPRPPIHQDRAFFRIRHCSPLTAFGKEADAVGQTIKMGGQATEVVGVVTDNFFGIGVAFAPAAFWVPLEHVRRLSPAPVSAAYFDPARRDVRCCVPGSPP